MGRGGMMGRTAVASGPFSQMHFEGMLGYGKFMGQRTDSVVGGSRSSGGWGGGGGGGGSGGGFFGGGGRAKSERGAFGRHLVIAKLESMPIDSPDTWLTENPIPMTKRRQPW